MNVDLGYAMLYLYISIASTSPSYLSPFSYSQIIPEDAYQVGTPAYDGVFHCRFWRFGQWVDVYCDDDLPVKEWITSFKPWGARSKHTAEMWVSLMEKAFAKWVLSYILYY